MPQDINFIPSRDRILVRLVTEEEGSIKVPDGARPRPQRGIVLAVGPGLLTDSGQLLPMSYAKGQTILFGKYAGAEQPFDDEILLIMREEEVLGCIPPSTEVESYKSL